jgi:hypothetical protein
LLSLALVFFAWVVPAKASSVLDPQNRVHVGVSYVDAPSPIGITGGFASVVPMAPGIAAEDIDYSSYFELRHGVYLMPGIRIPHPQPRTWAFDFFIRAGGGAVWFANTDPTHPGFEHSNYVVTPGPAAMAGGDAQVRFGSLGIRLSGKAVGFGASRDSVAESWFLVRSQWGAEGFFQW